MDIDQSPCGNSEGNDHNELCLSQSMSARFSLLQGTQKIVNKLINDHFVAAESSDSLHIVATASE